jgi:FlaA1/EpsC-like NDP-sugar epimerase
MPTRIFRNRVFFTLDFVGWLVIPVLALALRLDGLAGVAAYRESLLVFVAVSAICKSVTLWHFGLYRRYWGYASIDEMFLVIASVLVAGVVAGVLFFTTQYLVVLGPPRLPLSTPLIDALLTLIYVGGSRFALRATMQWRLRVAGHPAREPVLIVGAGDAGMMIAKELRANPQLKLEPVAFVDDDPDKQRSTILGLPVLGPRENLPEIARANGVRQVIIAIPRAPGRMVREIRDLCEGAGLTAKTVPGIFDIISGRVGVSQIRNVQIEDLLRRDAVETDQAAVAEMLEGMTVLVTGAGGSIGSEMCRQIAGFNARQIILLGHGENSIFEVHNELKAKFTSLELIPVIADIRNTQRIGEIFERLRPQAVFHAAAHKHVPLMEMNPVEAVTNNVGGTQNVLAAAERTGVSHFVLISTDKAVKPSSVMGATKLIAETLVHAAAERTGAIYVSVRFGNVLGSRGSVVPLFQRQIAAGGPVTVTHPEMTRYFMTIPEAVQLVLQAAALGAPGSGETFVLDMGEPMKIVQLARDLIQLSGLEEGRDIEITFTGLRPGEKMFEELFLESEGFGRTAHGKVFAARNGERSSMPIANIARLTAAAEAGDGVLTLRLLAEAAPSLRQLGGRRAGVASAKARTSLP